MAAKKGKAPSLHLRLETTYRCDYNALDIFVKEVTGHDFSSWETEEWSRDSYNRFVVNGELDKHDKKVWENFKKSGKNELYTLRAILNGLANEGRIQTGIYLIDTF